VQNVHFHTILIQKESYKTVTESIPWKKKSVPPNGISTIAPTCGIMYHTAGYAKGQEK
jgi:hypothetical protein